MATTPTQIRIDTTIKEQANNLFASLGMDMSSAVNIFLRQCILRGGLPFAVEIPQYNQATLDALAEARRISILVELATSLVSTVELSIFPMVEQATSFP